MDPFDDVNEGVISASQQRLLAALRIPGDSQNSGPGGGETRDSLDSLLPDTDSDSDDASPHFSAFEVNQPNAAAASVAAHAEVSEIADRTEGDAGLCGSMMRRFGTLKLGFLSDDMGAGSSSSQSNRGSMEREGRTSADEEPAGNADRRSGSPAVRSDLGPPPLKMVSDERVHCGNIEADKARPELSIFNEKLSVVTSKIKGMFGRFADSDSVNVVRTRSSSIHREEGIDGSKSHAMNLNVLKRRLSTGEESGYSKSAGILVGKSTISTNDEFVTKNLASVLNTVGESQNPLQNDKTFSERKLKKPRLNELSRGISERRGVSPTKKLDRNPLICEESLPSLAISKGQEESLSGKAAGLSPTKIVSYHSITEPPAGVLPFEKVKNEEVESGKEPATLNKSTIGTGHLHGNALGGEIPEFCRVNTEADIDELYEFFFSEHEFSEYAAVEPSKDLATDDCKLSSIASQSQGEVMGVTIRGQVKTSDLDFGVKRSFLLKQSDVDMSENGSQRVAGSSIGVTNIQLENGTVDENDRNNDAKLSANFHKAVNLLSEDAKLLQQEIHDERLEVTAANSSLGVLQSQTLRRSLHEVQKRPIMNISVEGTDLRGSGARGCSVPLKETAGLAAAEKTAILKSFDNSEVCYPMQTTKCVQQNAKAATPEKILDFGNNEEASLSMKTVSDSGVKNAPSCPLTFLEAVHMLSREPDTCIGDEHILDISRRTGYTFHKSQWLRSEEDQQDN